MAESSKRGYLASEIAALRNSGAIIASVAPTPEEKRTDILATALQRCAERSRRQLVDSIVFMPCRKSLDNERGDGVCLPVVPLADRQLPKAA